MKVSPVAENNNLKLSNNPFQSRELSKNVKNEEIFPKKNVVQANSEDKGGLVDVNPEKLDELIKAANEVMDALNKKMEFSIHEGTNRPMVKIVDKRDGTLIKEIPPEKILDLLAKMWEVVGLFVDEKV